MAIPISEENILDYIEEAESKLLKPGDHFDEQSREFICCLESKDVIACPGSGKTTALVAKLYILTKFMPFEDGSGMCVLTHTNVAIDLIKEKLGKQGSILFEHPNFCGTIQSFVDAYLAQPMYVSMYGHRINTIDDDITYAYISSKLRKWNKTCHNTHFLELVRNLRYDYIESKWVNKNGTPFTFPQKFIGDESKFVRDEVMNRKRSAIKKGILFYDEAYMLGRLYLSDEPSLSRAFCKRFKFLFVDEAQDTSSVQYNTITALFSESVIQMIGDPNQTIFDNSEPDDEDICTWSQVVYSKPHIRIHNSKRLTNRITNSIKDIAEFPESNLNGLQNGDIKPTLLFYPQNRILEVIPKFAEMININGLIGITHYPHKVIGRIVKRNQAADHFTVPSFFPAYYRASKKKMFFDGLRQYLIKPKYSEDVRQVKQVSDLLVNSLIRMLTLAESYDSSSRRKPYTKTSLIEYLSKWHQDKFTYLLTKVSTWSRRILSHSCGLDCPNSELQYPTCVLNEIVNYVAEIFFPLFGADFNKIQTFIECEVEEIQSGLHLDNEYHGSIDGQDIRIEVGSVHSVKGETHTSTLFLDTFYRSYDSTRLVRFFTSGGRNTDRRNDSICKALRVAYVAMSRPTHLLCVAFPLPEGQPILDYWLSKPEQERLWDIADIQ